VLKFIEYMIAVAILAAAVLLAPFEAARAQQTESVGIVIGDPWIRATPPGAPVAAGYMVITNRSKTPDRLVGATLEKAGIVEMHTMKIENGTMKMRPLSNGIALAPGQSVMLKPGGEHLMFLRITGPFEPGATVNGTVTFEKAGTIAVAFPVRRVGAGGKKGMDHKGGHMGGEGGTAKKPNMPHDMQK
jgi:copper(I)-binding protein